MLNHFHGSMFSDRFKTSKAPYHVAMPSPDFMCYRCESLISKWKDPSCVSNIFVSLVIWITLCKRIFQQLCEFVCRCVEYLYKKPNVFGIVTLHFWRATVSNTWITQRWALLMDMCCKPLIWCQQCHVKRVFLHTNTFPFSLISLHISLRPVLALTSKVADFSSYWIFRNFYHYLFFATYTLFICRCAIFSHNLNKCVLWVLSCVSWRHWTSHTPRSFSLLHIRWKYMDLVISSLRLWLLLQLRCKYFRIHR